MLTESNPWRPRSGTRVQRGAGGGRSDGGDNDEQVRDVGHAVHEVRRDAIQVLVGEVT